MTEFLFTHADGMVKFIGSVVLLSLVQSMRQLRGVIADMDTRLRWLELRDEADLNSEDE